ncbi:hypothetical protein PVK06_028734 [Gossypium arboreum]|uniref:Uncharacterized protein n=1 Tax=Gossypium arboreum TaxID=29729 RepID=A0ABR0P4N2_GOSAR|nr:hypothetical protein PVK06_028734 [Gossypium arboreum]
MVGCPTLTPSSLGKISWAEQVSQIFTIISVHCKLPNTVAVMDVFIPEEYVIMRRIEKKTDGIGGKRRNMVAVEASKKLGKENMAQQLPPTYRVESKELLIPGGITETVVFCCLSA